MVKRGLLRSALALPFLRQIGLDRCRVVGKFNRELEVSQLDQCVDLDVGEPEPGKTSVIEIIRTGNYLSLYVNHVKVEEVVGIKLVQDKEKVVLLPEEDESQGSLRLFEADYTRLENRDFELRLRLKSLVGSPLQKEAGFGSILSCISLNIRDGTNSRYVINSGSLLDGFPFE